MVKAGVLAGYEQLPRIGTAELLILQHLLQGSPVLGGTHGACRQRHNPAIEAVIVDGSHPRAANADAPRFPHRAACVRVDAASLPTLEAPARVRNGLRVAE